MCVRCRRSHRRCTARGLTGSHAPCPGAGQKAPAAQHALEINPQHPLVTRINDEADEERFNDWAHLLYEQALLAEGGQLENPAGFVKRLNSLLALMG